MDVVAGSIVCVLQSVTISPVVVGVVSGPSSTVGVGVVSIMIVVMVTVVVIVIVVLDGVTVVSLWVGLVVCEGVGEGGLSSPIDTDTVVSGVGVEGLELGVVRGMGVGVRGSKH